MIGLRWLTLAAAIALAAAALAQGEHDLPTAPTPDCPAPRSSIGERAVVQPGAQSLDPALVLRVEARYLGAADAILQATAPDTVLVDIRRPAELAELRIPGALNIPPHQVKTKGFLRDKRLLLVDAGYRYRPAERTAAELEAAGFRDVRIIEGGLGAWHAAGGELIGPALPSRLRTLAPAALAAEARFPHWRVVTLGDPPAQRAAQSVIDDNPAMPTTPVAEAVAQPLDAPAAHLASDAVASLPDLAAELTAAGDDGLMPLILLIDADGRAGTELLAQHGDDAPWNLFVLEGGLEAWQTEVQQLAVMQARRLAPAPRSGACGD